MSSEFSNNPTHEREARLTALLLGELPEQEAAALQRAIEHDPELARLYQQLSRTIGLVREVVASGEATATAQQGSIKLSAEKREKLLQSFKTIRPAEFTPWYRRMRVSREWAALAAMVVALGILAAPLLKQYMARLKMMEGIGDPLAEEVDVVALSINPDANAPATMTFTPAPPQEDAAKKVSGQVYLGGEFVQLKQKDSDSPNGAVDREWNPASGAESVRLRRVDGRMSGLRPPPPPAVGQDAAPPPALPNVSQTDGTDLQRQLLRMQEDGLQIQGGTAPGFKQPEPKAPPTATPAQREAIGDVVAGIVLSQAETEAKQDGWERERREALFKEKLHGDDNVWADPTKPGGESRLGGQERPAAQTAGRAGGGGVGGGAGGGEAKPDDRFGVAVAGQSQVVPPPQISPPVQQQDGGTSPPGYKNGKDATIEEALDAYADASGRMVLRPNRLPDLKVELPPQTPLSQSARVNSLERVLSDSGVTMIPQGEKYVKAVPQAQATQEAAEHSQSSPRPGGLAGREYVGVTVVRTNSTSSRVTVDYAISDLSDLPAGNDLAQRNLQSAQNLRDVRDNPVTTNAVSGKVVINEWMYNPSENRGLGIVLPESPIAAKNETTLGLVEADKVSAFFDGSKVDALAQQPPVAPTTGLSAPAGSSGVYTVNAVGYAGDTNGGGAGEPILGRISGPPGSLPVDAKANQPTSLTPTVDPATGLPAVQEVERLVSRTESNKPRTLAEVRRKSGGVTGEAGDRQGARQLALFKEKLFPEVESNLASDQKDKLQRMPGVAGNALEERAEQIAGEDLEVKTRGAKETFGRLEKEVDEKTPKPTPPSAPVPQPEVYAAENPFSTFSLNVSDVSFKLAEASLQKGAMPEPATIRSEEFINAFDYRDPEPAAGQPVAFAWEHARYPFGHNRDLLRFSIKTSAIGRQAGKPVNLVLLLDNSGSMERADRVRIIQECLRVLAIQLKPEDRVSVVAFSRTPRLWVDGLAGNQAGELVQRVGSLTPQGGTNLEEGMNLAYETARRHFVAHGINRVVVLTDGAANLGDVEPQSLKQKVETQRKQGIALDCFGIGWEGYNDDLLEQLSRNGDGRYGFVNTPEAAATEFAGQLVGALQVAASDVKVQVEFNPRRVTTYRQIGYAKHQLQKEQFRDNTVDAAEIAAAEAGNALYTVQVNPRGEGPIGVVRVRYKVPGTAEYFEHEWTVPFSGAVPSIEDAGSAIRLAGVAGAFSEWLAASPFAGEVKPDGLLRYLSGVTEAYGANPRPARLESMIRQAVTIAGAR